MSGGSPDGFLKKISPNSIRTSLFAGFGAAILVGGLMLLKPNKYRSEAKILPVTSKANSIAAPYANAAAMLGLGGIGGDGSDSNFTDILTSRRVLEGLLNTEFSFSIRTWRFGQPIQKKQTLLRFLRAKNIDHGCLLLGQQFGASRDLKTKVLYVSMDSTSPELCQRVVNESLKALERYIMLEGQTRGSAKASFNAMRLAEAKEIMEKAEGDLRSFASVNRNYLSSSEPAVRLMGARLERNLLLANQIVSTLAVSYEQSLLEAKNDIPVLSILDPGNLPVEKSGPNRTLNVLISFLVACVATFAYLNRLQILKLQEME